MVMGICEIYFSKKSKLLKITKGSVIEKCSNKNVVKLLYFIFAKSSIHSFCNFKIGLFSE